MLLDVQQLERWLVGKEDSHLEFKEAKQHFEFEELARYCSAFANEGGGYLVLGVTNKMPRRVIGSQAFRNLGDIQSDLLRHLRLRIEVAEIAHPNGRVVVFHSPLRPIGMPVAYKGVYWMRIGEELTVTTPERLRQLFDEGTPDFTAEICTKATLVDLDSNAIERLRQMWIRKSGNHSLANLSTVQLLSDAELVVEGAVTYAALILLGSHQALGKHLAQAEVIFEYRSNEASGTAAQRKEFRQGFFLFFDELWDLINLRNDLQHYQEGLFIYDIPTFNEISVREALLNAVSHRNYRLGGSVFVRQYPRHLEFTSPGGLPPGITVENILNRQYPRNRRIVEVFARCGLVERSGQGMNRMFEGAVRESKALPNFAGSDEYQVSLTLAGEVQDPYFLRFLEKIGNEQLAHFNTQDFLVLDLVRNERAVPNDFKASIERLIASGIIERIGRGRGVRYLLSRKFYEFINQRGVYTRRRGLDHRANKALVLEHIRENNLRGSPLSELKQVVPALSQNQVQKLLQQMKKEKLIYLTGKNKSSRWFASNV